MASMAWITVLVGRAWGRGRSSRGRATPSNGLTRRRPRLPSIVVEGAHRRSLTCGRASGIAPGVEKSQITAGVEPLNAVYPMHSVSIAIVEELGQVAAVGVDRVGREVSLLAKACQVIVDGGRGPCRHIREMHCSDPKARFRENQFRSEAPHRRSGESRRRFPSAPTGPGLRPGHIPRSRAGHRRPPRSPGSHSCGFAASRGGFPNTNSNSEMRSSTPRAGIAPSRIRRLHPTDAARSTSPGTANTGRPSSAARRAVINAPPFDRPRPPPRQRRWPRSRRFLAGKRHRSGGVPGGYSDITAPCAVDDAVIDAPGSPTG